MRDSGFISRMSSPMVSSANFIILLGNGPQAIVLDVMPLGPSTVARCRLRWCSPALAAL